MGSSYLPATPEKTPARQRAKAQSAARTSFTFRCARGAQSSKSARPSSQTLFSDNLLSPAQSSL